MPDTKIKENPALLAAITSNITEILAFYESPTMRISWANKAHAEAMGMPIKELIGKRCFELWHPKGTSCENCPIEGVFKHGTVQDAEITTSDGRTFEIKGYPIKDESGGDIMGVLGLTRDITEKKMAGNKLKESEKRYRKIIESIPMGMHMYTLQPDGRLVFTGANPAAEKILKTDMKQFVGKTIEEAFPGLKDTEVPEKYRLVAKNGITWKTNQIDYEDEKIKGAYEVWAFQTSPGKMVATFFDITEKLKANEALKKSEERYNLINKNAYDMISIVTLEGKYEYINEEAHLKNVGYKEEELLNMGPMDLVHPDDLNYIMLEYKKILEKETSKIQFRIKNKQTEKYNWYESTGTLFQDKDGIPKILSITRDISDRKKIEELLERENTRLKEMDRIRKEFVSNAAHELKTPLIPIYSATEFLLMKYKDQMHPDVRELIETTFRGAQKLKQLLGELLDISRLDLKKIELKIEEVDILELIQEIITRLEQDILKHGHKVNLNIPEKLFIHVDKVRIEQVITNLLSNAIKNTPDDGQITIKVVKRADQVEISVSDTGVGITTEEFKNLFTQFGTFHRRNAELGIVGGGTGLGLYISKEIVELHGGMIEAKSEGRNKGAIFTVYLPIVE